MALSIIQGKPGQGKSFVAVCLYILPALLAGRYVATNIEMNPETIADVFLKRYGKKFDPARLQILHNSQIGNLFEHVPGGHDPADQVMVVIDEAHKYFNARDFAKNDAKHRDTFVKLTEHRHYHFEIIFLSQSVKNIDAQIVRLHNGLTSLRNLREWHIPRIPWLKIPYYDFLAIRRDGDGKTIMRRDWLRMDRQLASCYNTHSIGSADKLAGGSVQRVNLTADPVMTARLAKIKKYAKAGAILTLLAFAALIGRWTMKPAAVTLQPAAAAPPRSGPVVYRGAPAPPAPPKSIKETAAGWIASAPTVEVIVVRSAVLHGLNWSIMVPLDGTSQRFTTGGWTTRGRIGSVLCLIPSKLWDVRIHCDDGTTQKLRLAMQPTGVAGPPPGMEDGEEIAEETEIPTP